MLLNPTMLTECARTVTTQKVGQRKPSSASIQIEHSTQKDCARTATSQFTIRVKEAQRKTAKRLMTTSTPTVPALTDCTKPAQLCDPQ